MSAVQAFSRARWRAVTKHPYLTSFLFARPVFARTGLAPTVVLQDALEWNEDHFLRLGPDDSAYAIMHEFGHWLFDTAERAKRHRAFDDQGRTVPTNQDCFWFAGCVAVNEWLKEKWPNIPYTATTFGLASGKTTEWYYEHMAMSVSAMPASDCKYHTVTNSIFAEALRGQVSSMMPLGDTPCEELLRFLAQYKNRMDFAKYCAQRTSRAAAEASSALRTFTRMDKRSCSERHLRLAGKRQTQRASIAWILDTSGSIDDGLRDRFASELQALLDSGKFDLFLIVNDAAVHAAEAITSFRQAAALVRGGGGTDFTPAFDRLVSLKRRFDAVFVLTDGIAYVPLSNPLPRTQTYWVVYGSAAQPASWGKTIREEEEK